MPGRLLRLVGRGNPVYRIVVSQHPGQGRQHRPAGYQVAVRVDAGEIEFPGIDLQGELDPLVVGQLVQKRRLVIRSRVLILQVVQKIFGNLQKIRRLRTMRGKIPANQDAPAFVTHYFAQYRKGSGQQFDQVVEKQVPVNGHSPVFDTVRCWLIHRVANMRGKSILQLLERQVFIHAKLSPRAATIFSATR
ncbi:hypothetical protein MnTg04_00148 [bacterium MnTg04]|nr:hypothetical protein MnTg04_00148 [bacterium MnTg04]